MTSMDIFAHLLGMYAGWSLVLSCIRIGLNMTLDYLETQYT